MFKKLFGKRKTAPTQSIDVIFDDPRYANQISEVTKIVNNVKSDIDEPELDGDFLTLALDLSVLDFWNAAVGCDDFTDEDLEIWMGAFIPTIKSLNGAPVAPRHIKTMTEKAGQEEMAQEKAVDFVKIINDLLLKNGLLK